MKGLILILLTTLTFSANAYDGSSIKVRGQVDASFDLFSVKGNLKDLKEIVQNLDGGEGKLKFEVVKNNDYLKSPRKIANYIFKNIFGNIQVTAPFPCGYHTVGEIGGSYVKRTTYIISGEGDGGIDTCTGSGGPGGWFLELKVILNKDKKTGRAEFSWYEE